MRKNRTDIQAGKMPSRIVTQTKNVVASGNDGVGGDQYYKSINFVANTYSQLYKSWNTWVKDIRNKMRSQNINSLDERACNALSLKPWKCDQSKVSRLQSELAGVEHILNKGEGRDNFDVVVRMPDGNIAEQISSLLVNFPISISASDEVKNDINKIAYGNVRIKFIK